MDVQSWLNEFRQFADASGTIDIDDETPANLDGEALAAEPARVHDDARTTIGNGA